MKKIFYEKKGRKYVPVAEYDSELLDSFPKGNHLVMCYPGGSSRRFNINPDYAAMIAAGRVAEDAMSEALMEAGKLRLASRSREREMTPGQKAAWQNLVKEFGDSARQLEWPSAREVAEKGVEAMIKEAEVILSNPEVRKAYDHFILLAELSK